MLVILAGNQLLSPQQVCPQCLLADRAGQPRWHNGQLKCGAPIVPSGGHPPRPQSQQFECPMGFRIIQVDDG